MSMINDLNPWSSRFDAAAADRVIIPQQMIRQGKLKEGEEPEIDYYMEWLEQIPETKLSSQAKRLYRHLVRWAQKDGVAYQHQQTMATSLGLTVNSIDRHIRSLKNYGLIESTRRARNVSAMYRLLWLMEMPYPRPERGEGGEELVQEQANTIDPFEEHSVSQTGISIRETELPVPKTGSIPLIDEKTYTKTEEGFCNPPPVRISSSPSFDQETTDSAPAVNFEVIENIVATEGYRITSRDREDITKSLAKYWSKHGTYHSAREIGFALVKMTRKDWKIPFAWLNKELEFIDQDGYEEWCETNFIAEDAYSDALVHDLAHDVYTAGFGHYSWESENGYEVDWLTGLRRIGYVRDLAEPLTRRLILELAENNKPINLHELEVYEELWRIATSTYLDLLQRGMERDEEIRNDIWLMTRVRWLMFLDREKQALLTQPYPAAGGDAAFEWWLRWLRGTGLRYLSPGSSDDSNTMVEKDLDGHRVKVEVVGSWWHFECQDLGLEYRCQGMNPLARWLVSYPISPGYAFVEEEGLIDFG